MCNESSVLFVARSLSPGQVLGASIVEFGSRGFGVRYLLETWNPKEYVGVDLAAGPGVDVVDDVTRSLSRFGPSRFDIVISTEMLEHVRDWKAAVNSMKAICKPDGRVILTTRSPGFPYHAAPFDFWRFDPADLRSAFSDFAVLSVEKDPLAPGVFLTAGKPASYAEKNLATVQAYSIPLGKRTALVDIPGPPFARAFKLRAYRMFARVVYGAIQAGRRRAR